MRSMLRKALTRPHRLPALLRAQRELDRLGQHPHELVRRVAQACDDALHGRFDAEAAAVVDRIEGLRQRASASTERVLFEDFGAGSPTANLSEAEMAAGRQMQRTVGELSRAASKRPVWAALLWHLVRALKPTRGVELGCCVGVSACYQAEAMRLNGNGGRLWTLEGARALAAVSQRHFAELSVTNVDVVVGRFQDTLDGVLAERGPIDYAFIDGHHDEAATARYLEQILPHCQPRALLVFDDIDWSAGMARAWQAIEADPRIPLAIDCGEIGLCVLEPALTARVRARAPLW
jgi:predicted O-methyltransferase YrrM